MKITKIMIITIFLLLNAPAALANPTDEAIKALTHGNSAVLCENGSSINKSYVKVLQHFSQSQATIKMQQMVRVNDTYNNKAICVMLERIETP